MDPLSRVHNLSQVPGALRTAPGIHQNTTALPGDTITVSGTGAPSSSGKPVPTAVRDTPGGGTGQAPAALEPGEFPQASGTPAEKPSPDPVPSFIATIEEPPAAAAEKVASIKLQSKRLATAAWKQLAIMEPPEGSRAGCRQELHDISARGESYQVRERHRVLGEPRLNRPYPDPSLTEAGVKQNLPMEVKSNFKWLLSTPLVMGRDNDMVLLPTQYEGGPTWLGDGEYECRDFFIAVKRDPDTGIYKEIGAIMTRQPGWQDVYRSVGRTERIPGTDNLFGVYIEGGTYNAMGLKDTLVYEIHEKGIEQVGEWRGHVPFGDLDRHAQKPREEWHRLTC